tara:strand:+ start:2180 stop:2449 length:270 start_codon:yes stop_codon:yes gene_type:complete
VRQARQIYYAIRDSPEKVAQIRNWYAEVAFDCNDPDKQLETTSFTLNGQSASGTLSGNKQQLLNLLSNVVKMINDGAAYTTRVTGCRLG